MNLLKMTDLDLNGKKVLIRQDLNVPIKNGEVTSDKRIVASLPTILYATKAGAKVMITSHLGRPNAGEFEEKFSLQPVADHLSKLLGQKVRLETNWLDGIEMENGRRNYVHCKQRIWPSGQEAESHPCRSYCPRIQRR